MGELSGAEGTQNREIAIGRLPPEHKVGRSNRPGRTRHFPKVSGPNQQYFCPPSVAILTHFDFFDLELTCKPPLGQALFCEVCA